MVGLIDLSNAVTNLVSTMQLLKSDGHLRNPELRQNLVAKLPTTLQLQWGENAQQKRTSDITLADFSTWLTARADAASLVSHLSCSQPRIKTKSSGGNSKPHFAATQTAMARSRSRPPRKPQIANATTAMKLNTSSLCARSLCLCLSRSDWSGCKKKMPAVLRQATHSQGVLSVAEGNDAALMDVTNDTIHTALISQDSPGSNRGNPHHCTLKHLNNQEP